MAHAGGRPSKKDTINLEVLSILAAAGKTDAEISKLLNISEVTLNKYKKSEEFLKSLKNGKEIADQRVIKSLYERACGYEHEDVDIRVVDHAIVKTKIIKHYPPDTTACIFWLKNRNPQEWRERQEVEHQFSEANLASLVAVIKQAKV